VSGAATNDKEAKGPEETVVRKSRASAANKKGERAGNDDIRDTDGEIGENVGPDEARIADVTVPMRKKVGGKEEAREEPEEKSRET